MVVPSTADAFRTAVHKLTALDGRRVCVYKYSRSCVRLLVKNSGRGRAESVVREELELLDIHVQGVTQLRSRRHDHDPTKDCPPTTHFIVSVARETEVLKVRALGEMCGLRVSVESYVAPRGPLQFKRYHRFGHPQRNCGFAPGASRVGAFTSPVGALPRGNSLSDVDAEETTRRNTVGVLSGRK
jgi:hypothetical protein